MRPITSPLLQQNNNNNYPCLSAAGSGPLPHKCARPALPLSSSTELGLTGLPLIRGLRAWALCSRSRHRLGGPVGQACPRPADVHLSPELGLALGLDARRAGIGALVATLQSSEGSSRTQTQSLFLRTAQAPAPQSGGVLRGWLRSRTGGSQAPPAHTAASRARERSGRRWRKSANHTAAREKPHTRQHRQDIVRRQEHTVVLSDVHGEERTEELRQVVRKELRQEHGEEHTEELRLEVRKELQQEHGEELTEELQQELRKELRQEVRKELRQEHGVELRQEHGEDQTEELRQDVRKELQKEHGEERTEELQQEVRKELRQEVRKELRQKHGVELRQGHGEERTEEFLEEVSKELRQEHGVELRQGHREEHTEELPEEIRKELRQEHGEFREEAKNELRDHRGEELGEEHREKLREEHTEELRDEHREELRNEHRGKHCKELRDESRHGHREEPREEHRLRCAGEHESKEQQTRDLDGEQKILLIPNKTIYNVFSQICSPNQHRQEEHREELRDEVREEPREEVREEHREEPRQEVREESTEDPTQEIREGPTEEPRQEVREEPTEEPRQEVREEPTEEPRQEVREEHREECEHIVGEKQEIDLKEHKRLLSQYKLNEDSLFRAPTVESVHKVQTQTLTFEEPHDSTHTSSKQLQNTSRAESEAASDTDDLVCHLWDPAQSPACTVSSCPQGGGTCRFNTEGADPLTVRWNGPWATEKETSSGEHCWSLSQDWSFSPGSDHQEQGPQRDCSLDSNRETSPEELEFGGFMQAPSAWSPERTSHSWSYSSTDQTCSSWDQSDCSWAAFPEDGTQTEDCGGQWWAPSSTPEASRSMGSIFTNVFPSPPDQAPSKLADSTTPTLTQLLRESVAHTEGCQYQRLLDPFHDLNRMIEQGNRRDSGVSRERLQWSLGLTPPASGSGTTRAHRCLSFGHTYSYPGLL